MFAGPLGGATDYTYYNIGSLVSESTVPGGTESFEYNELNLHNKHYDNDKINIGKYGFLSGL